MAAITLLSQSTRAGPSRYPQYDVRWGTLKHRAAMDDPMRISCHGKPLLEVLSDTDFRATFAGPDRSADSARDLADAVAAEAHFHLGRQVELRYLDANDHTTGMWTHPPGGGRCFAERGSRNELDQGEVLVADSH